MKGGLILFCLACLTGLALLGAPERPLPGEVVPRQALFKTVDGPRWIDRAAQIAAESGFRADAVSPAGAKGWAQFMDGTWAYAIRRGWVPPGASPFDPVSAVLAQRGYMGFCEAYCEGFEPGLGGFNAGPGWIRKAQWIAKSMGMTDSRAWLRTLPRVTGERNAGETRGYIDHNAANRAAYRAALSRLGVSPWG